MTKAECARSGFEGIDPGGFRPPGHRPSGRPRDHSPTLFDQAFFHYPASPNALCRAPKLDLGNLCGFCYYK
ncbi:uncharacterized protein METZ01_LOCUS478192 [marine metagenome]|uniref:Uncharacterized protein n=1 Tax=marine metagenome TaxID=408172 RepID=A0A383C136_9ZZZZ